MNTSEAVKIITAALEEHSGTERVYTPRSLPAQLDQYPLIVVTAPVEHKTSPGRHTPQFTTVTTIRIDGRVLAYDSEEGRCDGDGIAWEGVLELKERIERALIGNPDVRMKFQQISTIRSQTGVDSQGAGHIAQVLLEMDFEYYQGPEDFFISELAPLRVVNVRGVNPPFRLHIDLTAGDKPDSKKEPE